MSAGLPPRAVVITRATDYEDLLARHGTREQARFFLASRGQGLDEIEASHREIHAAVATVLAAIPQRWRRTRARRTDLDRFLFEPEDVIVAVGQDGLVANVAKYLTGQAVVGVCPSPSSGGGVLARHAPETTADLLPLVAEGSAKIEERTMVEATTGDGQRLVALNEIFVGHQTHQSARYRVGIGARRERHSSSGLIVATGTGATGWARSIHRSRTITTELPSPTARRLAFFVREAFPSATTGTTIDDGSLGPDERLEVTSEMNEGGVVFGDGIEVDHIDFHWGTALTIGIASAALRLVQG